MSTAREKPWKLYGESAAGEQTYGDYPDEQSARTAAQDMARSGYTDISMWTLVAVMLPRLIDVDPAPRG